MSDNRFTSQGSHAEDLLKNQTVGLVNLEDYRKRRVEAIEQSERDKDAQGNQAPSQTPSGAATPVDRSSTPQPQVKKKRKTGRGKLSFAVDDDDDDDVEEEERGPPRSKKSSKQATPAVEGEEEASSSNPSGKDGVSAEIQASKQAPVQADDEQEEEEQVIPRRRLGPNSSIANAPRVMTKAAQRKEAEERERLRKEFLAMQEEVKAADIAVPFVFFEGSDVPGGSCRIKKGDPVWLFLDRCRKLGAELAAGRAGEAKSRREWARVGVDDLLLVRKEIIIPHHYEFYYFIVNKTLGWDSLPLFNYSSRPTAAAAAVEAAVEAGTHNPLSRPGESREKFRAESSLEGSGEDPELTKVVHRRWYERNKHIFPASTWVEFDPEKDYPNEQRRDAQGNAYYFPR